MKYRFLNVLLLFFFLPKTSSYAFEINVSANPTNGNGTVLVYFHGAATGTDGPYSYSWDFDNSDGIDVDKFMQNPSFVYASPGIYTATLTVTNKYGDAKTASVNITVNPGVYKDTTEIVLEGIHASKENPLIIEGYEIGGYLHGQHGILIDSCSNVIVRDCYIHHPEQYVEFPIRINNSQNIEIRTSHLRANEYSLYVDSSSNCRIIGVLIDSTTIGQSININQSNNIEVAHCVLKNNGKPETWSNGIWFNVGCHHSSVHDNFVCNQSGGGIQITGIGLTPLQHTTETHSSHIDVYNNTIWHVHEEGTWLIGVSDINIYNNYYRVFCGHGVNMEWNASNIKIFNNVFCGDDGVTNANCWFINSSRGWEGSGGIRIGSSYGNDIVNNTFYKAGLTPIIYADTTLYPPGDAYENFYPIPCIDNVIKNNIIINRPGPYFEIDSWAEGMSYNNIIVETPVHDQPGLLSVDPLFRDADHGNFMLKSNSPCIDAGDPDSLYNDPENPNNPGYALPPALGTIRSDMGAYGGMYAASWDVVTAVESEPKESADSPKSLELFQNYPNPFNLKTTIAFELPELSDVRISIFNLSGQLVEEIFNGRKQAGYHSVTWDASNNATGTYFIKMVAGDFVQTRKYVLLK